MTSNLLETARSVGHPPPVPVGRVVIAVTDDGRDPRYAVVREAAARIAAASRGSVLLFHVLAEPCTSGGRPRVFVPPVASDGSVPARPHTGSRRRDLLVEEAGLVRARGAEVTVWLAPSCGPSALADAVDRTGADLVLLPAEPERRATGCPRVDRTLAYYASRIRVPVVAVDGADRLMPIAPLGSSAHPAARRVVSSGALRGSGLQVGALAGSIR